MTEAPHNIAPPSLADRISRQWSRLRKTLSRKKTAQRIEGHEIHNYEDFEEISAPLHEKIIKLRRSNIRMLWLSVFGSSVATYGLTDAIYQEHWFFAGLNIAAMCLHAFNIYRLIHLIESVAEEHRAFHEMEAIAMMHLPPKDSMMP